MSDLRNELDREVRRHKLPDGTLDRIAGRRDRRRRNRRAGTVAIALIVAALGSFGLIRAFGNAERPRPGVTPTPTPSSRPPQPGPLGLTAPAGPIQFLD